MRRGGALGSERPVPHFTRAVEQEPGRGDYLFNLGYAAATSGDHVAALQWLREAVRRAPADGDAHVVLSIVLSSTGKGVEAQRELDLAKMLGAPHVEEGTAVGGRLPRGLERLETDLDAWPALPAEGANAAPGQRDQQETAVFYLDRARRALDEGRERDASEALRRAVFLSPYEAEPHLLLGRIHSRAGRTVTAIDEFKLAIWCRETAESRLALASALLDSGERDAARKEAERALALDPASDATRALLRKIGGSPVLPSLDVHG